MWEFFHIRFWDLDLFPSYGSVSAKKWHWPLLERTTCNMILLLKNNNSWYAGHWCSWDIGQKLPLLCHSFSSVLCVYTVLIDSRYTKLIWYELKTIKKKLSAVSSKPELVLLLCNSTGKEILCISKTEGTREDVNASLWHIVYVKTWPKYLSTKLWSVSSFVSESVTHNKFSLIKVLQNFYLLLAESSLPQHWHYLNSRQMVGVN